MTGHGRGRPAQDGPDGNYQQTQSTPPPGFSNETALSAAFGYSLYLGPWAFSPDKLTSVRSSWSPDGGYRIRVGCPARDGMHMNLAEARELQRTLNTVLDMLDGGGPDGVHR